MRQDGFYALFPRSDSAWGRLFGPGRSAVHVDVKLRSGRRFRYNFSDYRFGPNLTPDQARLLAERIAREKYRDCDWDRNHPRVAAEAEIAEAVYELILEAVDRMRGEGGSPE